jgi:prepilin-type N-terminal cleavage/methylation domain-containing protein
MKRRVDGFSLVEVLVALAIAAVGLLAILDLQRQLVDGQRRYEQALANTELQRTALTFIRDLNPMASQSGQINLPPNISITWVSQAVGDSIRNTGLPVGNGNFMVQLFQLQVQIADNRSARKRVFTVDRVGWKALQLKPVTEF